MNMGLDSLCTRLTSYRYQGNCRKQLELSTLINIAHLTMRVKGNLLEEGDRVIQLQEEPEIYRNATLKIPIYLRVMLICE